MNTNIPTIAGKRILFIGVNFYYYTDDIRQKMKDAGADVTFFYERDVTVKHAIINAFFSKYLDAWQERYYRGVLKAIKGKQFDYLFVIRGYKMKGSFVEAVKAMNPGIKTIMYQWDSLTNWDCDYRPLLPYFDKSYTFDYLDAENLNIPYIPTFCIDEFADLPAVTSEYDFFYYGSYNHERYEFITRLIDYTNSKGYSLKTHLYMAQKLFIKERLHGTPLDKKYLTFKKMSRKEYVAAFNKARVIVDLPNSAQTGMAMRVLDALAAGKRVLTDNKYAEREPGYDPRQVIIYDRKHIDLPDWVNDHAVFPKKKYSIEQWLTAVFAGD